MWSLHGFLHGIKWIMFHGHLDYFQKPPLGGTPNTKPWDHSTPNTHTHRLIQSYHVWRPAWTEVHRYGIWSRAQLHMTSHYTWEPVTTLHDFGRALNTFFWALTISWSSSFASCVKWQPTRRHTRRVVDSRYLQTHSSNSRALVLMHEWVRLTRNQHS